MAYQANVGIKKSIGGHEETTRRKEIRKMIRSDLVIYWLKKYMMMKMYINAAKGQRRKEADKD
jgi:hypothetical protein